MKILSAAQIREWDQYTMQHEPISPIDLMERAAEACTHWILEHISQDIFYIFCTTGNNGGDGLVIARLLKSHNKQVKVFVLSLSAGTDCFNINLERLKQISTVEIITLKSTSDFPSIPNDAVIIDALFGTGLNRKPEGLAAELIHFINHTAKHVIAIDIPSGLLCDRSSKDFPVIKAAHTLSFQCYKPALLLPENAVYFGNVHILDIKLHTDFLHTVDTNYELVDFNFIKQLYKPRNAFSHKGSFGHALIIAGSYGKMGAAVLSTRACLRSGVGLVSAHVPSCGVTILQTAAPEAMCRVDRNEKVITKLDYDVTSYSAVGVGPGIGTDSATTAFLHHLLVAYPKPLVLDADALNILSEHSEWWPLLPPHSILTPHPKEFARLFEENKDDLARIETALQQARTKNLVIVLKGHRTFIATPSGKGYFNTSGNAGMATGGSGDVLTGIITGLLAQGYSSSEAAILGVYIHGMAGDQAALHYGMDPMIAGDIIDNLSVIKQLETV
jgi:yjeF C-terminal region, hydroxyethylthiazole kinase-related/yjeF N-terminal region